jgi:hypothetical protein
MSLVFLLLHVALAGAPEDLEFAADARQPEESRMQAFERLVFLGATDISHVTEVSGRESADARQRWVAVRVLGKVGGDGARNVLLKLLTSEMPAMRAAAAQALGDLGDASLAPALAELLKDPAIIVRAAVAQALGQLRNPEVVDALAEAVMAKDNWYRGSSLWVRRHYVAAMGEIGSEKAIPTLLNCLDDEDGSVASTAVISFERIAGFSFQEGRTAEEEVGAWRRWAQDRVR